MFQLIDIDFLTLADTNNLSDINIAFRSANNRHHYAMKLSLNMSEHSTLIKIKTEIANILSLK